MGSEPGPVGQGLEGTEGGARALEGVDEPLLPKDPPTAGVQDLQRTVSTLRHRLREALGENKALKESIAALRRDKRAQSERVESLESQVKDLESDARLAGASLHDGTLDLLRGKCLTETREERERVEEALRSEKHSREEAEGREADERHRREASEGAAKAELESLELEAAQARLSAQAKWREAENERDRAERAEAEREELGQKLEALESKANDDSQKRNELEEERKRLKDEAERLRDRAERAERESNEARHHVDWLERKQANYSAGDSAERHAGELRQVRDSLEKEKLALQSQLAEERELRESLETKLVSGQSENCRLDASCQADEDNKEAEALRHRVKDLESRLHLLNAYQEEVSRLKAVNQRLADDLKSERERAARADEERAAALLAALPCETSSRDAGLQCTPSSAGATERGVQASPAPRTCSDTPPLSWRKRSEEGEEEDLCRVGLDEDAPLACLGAGERRRTRRRQVGAEDDTIRASREMVRKAVEQAEQAKSVASSAADSSRWQRRSPSKASPTSSWAPTRSGEA